MSNKNNNNKKRALSEDDMEESENYDEESSDIQNNNAFNKILNKEKSNLSNIHNKGKGGSKLRSWIYYWGERKAHPTNPKNYIFKCNQKLDNGKNCSVEIETSGPTGNIISHRKHKIYEYFKPLTTEPPLKQTKIDDFTVSSKTPLMTSERQKYLENLLYEWLVLDCQPLYLLKSPAFCKFINALNEDFELPSSKEFRKRIFEAFKFTKNQLIQFIQENANSVSITCDLWTSRSKRGFLGVTLGCSVNKLYQVL